MISNDWNNWSIFTNNSKTTDITLDSLLQVKRELEEMRKKVIKMDTNTPPEPVFTEEQYLKRQCFEDAIIANLFEDTDKLIFADWLVDQEQEKYSRLVRFAIEEKVWPYSWVENAPSKTKYEEVYCWWNRPKGHKYARERFITEKGTNHDPSDVGTVFKFLGEGKRIHRMSLYNERLGYHSLYLALWDYRQGRERECIKDEGQWGGSVSNYD